MDVRILGFVPVFLLVACDPQNNVCSPTSFPGNYILSAQGTSYTLSLRADHSGEFSYSADAHALTWEFIPKYNLLELDLPRSDFDLLSEMMGLKRPADAIDTERGVVALTPVCDERGHTERFELSEEMSLEFIRR